MWLKYILAFTVDTKYESYRDKNNDYRQRFAGYEYTHVFKLEFPLDNALLGQLLYALAHAPVHPEFRINYTVKDPESTRCYSALSVRRKPGEIVKFRITRSSWKKTKNASESMRLFHEQDIPLTT